MLNPSNKLNDPTVCNTIKGLTVVGVIIVSVGLINVVSNVTEKLNVLSVQLLGLRSTYRNLVDYVNDLERCSYCNKPYRRKKCLEKHEYTCGLIDRLYS